jgi:GGDEF domain-containing protein
MSRRSGRASRTGAATKVALSGGMTSEISASIGAVVARDGDAGALKVADGALYEAKRAGKCCMRWALSTTAGRQGDAARTSHAR